MNLYTYEPIKLITDQNGIVVQVLFTITASDGIDDFTVYSQTALPSPVGIPITYDQLTKADVIAWIIKLVGNLSEALADSELAAYKNRKNILTITGMPWG